MIEVTEEQQEEAAEGEEKEQNIPEEDKEENIALLELKKSECNDQEEIKE